MSTSDRARQFELVNEAERQLGTTATFLSGVTATAIQYIQQPASTPLALIVVFLWFLSFVCSLGSALGYLFSIVWRARFVHKSPNTHTPRVIELMIHGTPTILLGVASILLLGGLPLYLFDTLGQSRLFVPVIIGLGVSLILVPCGVGGYVWMNEHWAVNQGFTVGGLPLARYDQMHRLNSFFI